MKNQDYKKDFIKCLEGIDRSRHAYDVFNDFLELSSLSLYNSIANDKNIEEQFMKLSKPYGDTKQFAELLGIVAIALEKNPCDFLGEVYMQAGFGNKNNGQFFTPYHVSELMAKVSLSKECVNESIQTKGYISVSDPCCGAGGLIIAASQAILQMGFNPQKVMMFQCRDIDISCCYMSYIQTSLLGLTGAVIHSNTITMEEWRAYVTPLSLLNPNFINNHEKVLSVKQAEPNVIPFRSRNPRQIYLDLKAGEKS